MAGSKLVLEARVSINGFILGLSVVVIPLIRTWFGRHDWVFDYLTETPGKIAISSHIALINGLLLLIYKGPLYKVGAVIRLPTSCFCAESYAEVVFFVTSVCFGILELI